MTEPFWKKCSNCKKPIGFKRTYWVCNVSTCNRVRTGLQFCSVECWDAHVPLMRHRESWAEERKAPGAGDGDERPDSPPVQPKARAPSPSAPSAVAPPPQSAPRAILRKKSDG